MNAAAASRYAVCREKYVFIPPFLARHFVAVFLAKDQKSQKLFEGKESRELFIAPAFAHARARYELFDTSFFAF